MLPKIKRHARIPAAVLICVFTWLCVEPWNFDPEYGRSVAIAQHLPMKSPKDKDNKAKNKLKPGPGGAPQMPKAAPPKPDPWPALMQRLDDAVVPDDTNAALSKKAGDDLDAVMSDIDAEYENLEAELKANRKMLDDMKADPELYRRQTEFEGKVRGKFKELKDGVREVKSKDKKQRGNGKKRMRKLLDEAKPKRLVELDPDNLPNKRITEKDITKKEPREGSKQGVLWRKKKVEIASSDPFLSGILAGAAPLERVSYRPDQPPDPEDLAPTIETQATPDIIALAESMNCNQVDMYNWVHNNIDFVPYYGSMKGANETLWQKEGNDMDQASLLISMYRYCNIPSRYVVGVVKVPIEDAMNWAGGFTDKNAALNAFFLGGIPLTAMYKGGQLTSINMEHVWVEAWLSMDRYRGAPDGSPYNLYNHNKPFNFDNPYEAGKMWFQLDASFKKYKSISAVDISNYIPNNEINNILEITEQNVDFDSLTGNVNGIQIFKDENIAERLLNKAIDFAETSTNIDNCTELFGSNYVLFNKLHYFNNSHNYLINRTLERFSIIPSEYAFLLIISIKSDKLYDDFDDDMSSLYFKERISKLASVKLSLKYIPASIVDENYLSNFIDKATIPAYNVNVKPALLNNGIKILEGNSVTLGIKQRSSFIVNAPANSSASNYEFDKLLVSGGYHAVGIHIGQPSISRLSAMKYSLENDISDIDNERQVLTNTILDDQYHTFIISYYYITDQIIKSLSMKNKYYYLSSPSIGFIHSYIDTYGPSWLPIPFSARTSGVGVDIKNSNIIERIDSTLSPIPLILIDGLIHSYFEGAIFKDVADDNGNIVTTVHILIKAINDNHNIYLINKDNSKNVLAVMSELPNNTKNDILNIVNRNNIVIMHDSPVTIGNWEGYGYISIDLITGSSGYIIDGGLNALNEYNNQIENGAVIKYGLIVLELIVSIYLIWCPLKIVRMGISLLWNLTLLIESLNTVTQNTELTKNQKTFFYVTMVLAYIAGTIYSTVVPGAADKGTEIALKSIATGITIVSSAINVPLVE
jgi:hypothetical protein